MESTFTAVRAPAKRLHFHVTPQEALRRTTFGWMAAQDVHKDHWPMGTPHRYLTRLFHLADQWLGHLRYDYPALTEQAAYGLAAAVRDCAAWNMKKNPAWSYSRIAAFALIRHWNNL